MSCQNCDLRWQIRWARRIEHGLLAVQAGFTCAGRQVVDELELLSSTRCAAPLSSHALLSSVRCLQGAELDAMFWV